MTTAPRSPILSWSAEFRACAALSWPLMLTNATEMAMNITSVAMIGHIGPEALAASTLGIALYFVLLLFGLGVTASVSALVARELGERGDRTAAVRRTVQQGFWGAATVAGPILVLLWNSGPVFGWAGQDAGLAADAVTYLRAIEWAIVPALAYFVLRSLFAAYERPRWIVITGLVAVALNALLNWLLIGGHAGLPALGLVGSGVATTVSNLFMAGTLAIVAAVHPRLRSLRLFHGLLRPDWTGFGAFWRLGLPIGMSLVLETGMFAVAAAMVGRFGTAALAAHAVALQVASFAFMVPLGIGQAATVRVGRAFGRGDRVGVARAGWAALALGLGTMVVSAAILVGLPHPIVGLFLADGEPGAADAQRLAAVLLSIAGLFQIADGAQVVLSGMLRGLQEGRVPMVIAGLGYWGIGLPLGFALAFRAGLGAPGVWLGLTGGLFAVAALLLVRWRWQLRRQASGGA